MVDPRTSTEGIRNYITEVSATVVLTIDLAYQKIVQSAKNTTVKQIILLSATDSMKFLLKSALKLKNWKKKATSSEIPSIVWSNFVKGAENNILIARASRHEDCCMIVHTGGTTGFSKGVMLSNDNVNAGFHQAFHTPITMQRQDVFLNIMPPFIAYGMVLGIHTALCWGWKSVLIPKFDPQKFGELLLKHRPNGLIGVPAYFENMLGSKKVQRADLSFIKVVLAGGDRTPVEFEQRLNKFLATHKARIHLSKGYSLTEASATATVSFENTVKLGSAGIPLVNTIISSFDENNGRELTNGELGEICISSPTIMMGYYSNDAATREIIRIHNDGTKWVHTGDFGYVDKDGLIYIEGRLKRMIVRYDGFKVFPPFIEKVILSNTAVDCCCAVGRPDPSHRHGMLPVVFAVMKSDAEISKSELRAELLNKCNAELPEYSQPVEILFVSELPLTPIGKIDYRTLEKQAEEMTKA